MSSQSEDCRAQIEYDQGGSSHFIEKMRKDFQQEYDKKMTPKVSQKPGELFNQESSNIR